MDLTPESDEAAERMWREVLLNGHRSQLAFLPGVPRCAICRVPLQEIGGRLAQLKGYRASPHNPHICNLCDDGMPVGGAEVDMAVLFADVRGSTELGERLGSREFAALLNRFYALVTEVLAARLAFVDKLVGDQVMALFYPANNGPDYRQIAVLAAEELMRKVGYAPDQEPWLPLGAAVHAGQVYFGKFGAGGVHTVTALGDTVNTAAHLQTLAAPGEILLSDEIYRSVQELYPDLEPRDLAIRGKDDQLRVHVLSLRGAVPTLAST